MPAGAAELYARSLNMRVRRVLLVSESGSTLPVPVPGMAREMAAQAADTRIEPGEQTLSVSLTVSFELE